MKPVLYQVICPRCRKKRQVQTKKWEYRHCRPCSQKGSQNLTPAARLLGAQRAAVTRRARWLSTLESLSKSEVARKFYRIGWKAGARSVRRRLDEAA